MTDNLAAAVCDQQERIEHLARHGRVDQSEYERLFELRNRLVEDTRAGLLGVDWQDFVLSEDLR